MKKVLSVFVFCVLAVIGLSISFYNVFGEHTVQASIANRLGVEITTNQKKCKLFLPANLSDDSGLQATIPIENGLDVAAVRVKPVMSNGKVVYNVVFLSGSYDKKLAQSDLNQISDREVVTRTASKDETLVIKDEKSKTPWELQIKTVEMPESSGVSDDVPIES